MRVKMRAFLKTDSEGVFNIFQSDSFRATLYTGQNFPPSMSEITAFVEESMMQKPERVNFALEEIEQKKLIGGATIKDIDYRRGVASLGFWISPEYQHQGYGYESLILICTYIFGELRMQKVALNCFEFNQAGLKLYEKAGFVQEGILRRDIFRGGKFYNTVVMGLLKEEFEAHLKRLGGENE